MMTLKMINLPLQYTVINFICGLTTPMPLLTSEANRFKCRHYILHSNTYLSVRVCVRNLL